MMNKEYVRQLVDRYFDGETTRHEEQMLYRYFREGRVPEELIPLRQMFLDMAAVQLPKQGPEVRAARIPRYKGVMAWAAVFVGLLVFGSIIKFQRDNSCVAYVYGKKVTDKAMVMQEVRNTMGLMVADGESVEAELKGIFD